MSVQDEYKFAETLLELAKAGDLTPGEGVKMFRDEFRCGLLYCYHIGLYAALQKAAGESQSQKRRPE